MMLVNREGNNTTKVSGFVDNYSSPGITALCLELSSRRDLVYTAKSPSSRQKLDSVCVQISKSFTRQEWKAPIAKDGGIIV